MIVKLLGWQLVTWEICFAEVQHFVRQELYAIIRNILANRIITYKVEYSYYFVKVENYILWISTT